MLKKAENTSAGEENENEGEEKKRGKKRKKKGRDRGKVRQRISLYDDWLQYKNYIFVTEA